MSIKFLCLLGGVCVVFYRCVCVCVFDREGANMFFCVCVCVCERGGGRERERETNVKDADEDLDEDFADTVGADVSGRFSLNSCECQYPSEQEVGEVGQTYIGHHHLASKLDSLILIPS